MGGFEVIKKVHFYEVNENDVILDSLKWDYPKFMEWWRKKRNENIYIYQEESSERIRGLLYFKVEEGEKYIDFNPPLSENRKIKIGTLKVTKHGLHLGEQFLKIVEEEANRTGIKEIYATIFLKRKEQIKMKKLMKKNGFLQCGVKNNGEIVVLKKLK